MGCGCGGFRSSGEIPAQFSDLNTIGGEAGQLMLRPYLEKGNANLTNVSDAAYFLYLGRAIRNFTPLFISFRVQAAGAGTQQAEVGFFSTPTSPNKAGQTLTKIVSTASVDALTSTGVKRNTGAFGTVVTAGTYLWAGLRVDMGTTEPDWLSCGRDLNQGAILFIAATAPLFSGAGPFVGTIPADAAEQAPYLFGELV